MFINRSDAVTVFFVTMGEKLKKKGERWRKSRKGKSLVTQIFMKSAFRQLGVENLVKNDLRNWCEFPRIFSKTYFDMLISWMRKRPHKLKSRTPSLLQQRRGKRQSSFLLSKFMVTKIRSFSNKSGYLSTSLHTRKRGQA